VVAKLRGRKEVPRQYKRHAFLHVNGAFQTLFARCSNALDGSWIGLRRMAESRASSREGAGCDTSPRPCRLSKVVT
jgi:hypothetical protein